MTATLAPVRTIPAVEIPAATLRAFASLVPVRSEFKSVPALFIIDPAGDGQVRLFQTDGRSAVILRADGECQQRMAVDVAILRRLMRAHADAEVFSVVANEDEPFQRLRTFSTGQTVAIETPAEKCFADAAAIDQIEALGNGEAGDGGRFHLHALQPLRTLLAATGSVGEFRMRVMPGDGPLVVDAAHEKGDWKVRLVVMRCAEPAK
jgi:hypothetical protein